MQVPESEVEFYRFETGFKDSKFVETILKDVKKSKKLKKEGEPYKTAHEMLEEYQITMDQLKQIIKAEDDAKNLTVEGKTHLSGNTRIIDGDVVRAYCRASELMVQCIEDAYKNELGFNVPITGEGLFGKTWGECH